MMFSRGVNGVVDALNKLSVTICGVGGIGSNLAVMLVRSGLRNIKIIDFDSVEISNLNRQYYFKSDIAKPKVEALKAILQGICEVEVVAINQKISEKNAMELLSGSDIICEGFDDADQKAMLANFVLTNLDSILIASSGMSGLLGEMKVRKVSDKFYVCGDESSDMSMGVASPRVSVCAGLMANLVLNLAIKKGANNG